MNLAFANGVPKTNKLTTKNKDLFSTKSKKRLDFVNRFWYPAFNNRMLRLRREVYDSVAVLDC